MFSSQINNVTFVFFQHQQYGFCFVPASATQSLFCSGKDNTNFCFVPANMAFVVFCNQQYVAFVFFRYQHNQHNGFCFVPASTTLLLFCSGINKIAFVFFQHKQHGFCFVPMSTTSSWNNTVEIILGTPFSFYTYSGS